MPPDAPLTADGAARPTSLAVVAEDEPLLRLDLLDTLADLGFAVLEASTAGEALRHLSAHPEVDLLVTDVQMPGGMDGFALARAVAAEHPAMRIVVCSAYYKPQPGQMPDGARFLDKPFNGTLLKGLLESMPDKP